MSESKSSGMDLFVMSYLTSYPESTFCQAKDEWDNISQKERKAYEKEAKANIKKFNKYKNTTSTKLEIEEDQYIHHTNPYKLRKRD